MLAKLYHFLEENLMALCMGVVVLCISIGLPLMIASIDTHPFKDDARFYAGVVLTAVGLIALYKAYLLQRKEDKEKSAERKQDREEREQFRIEAIEREKRAQERHEIEKQRFEEEKRYWMPPVQCTIVSKEKEGDKNATS